MFLFSRKIEIFLENGMLHFPDSQEVSFGAAFDLYKDSFRNIARSTNRDAVPVFAAFPRYFDDDDYYADTMIVRAQWICCLIFAHLITTI